MPVIEKRHELDDQKINLRSPCTVLHGVGPQLAQRLEKLGIVTLRDVLFHLPLRYQDRTRLQLIRRLRVGEASLIEGEIISSQLRKGRRISLLCHLKDDTGVISLRFFYFNATQRRVLSQAGTRLRCFGEIRWSGRQLEMVHPEYQVMKPGQILPLADRLTPVYPTTEGMQQTTWRRLTDQVLRLLSKGLLLEDYLPASVLEKLKLPDLISALMYVHRPPIDASLDLLLQGKHLMQQRLIVEELLAHRLSLERLRRQAQRHAAWSLSENKNLWHQFIERLPFKLTQAQRRVWVEVARDLLKSQPMLRLVQGDVGSGKTIVAAMAALQAVSNGYQVAVMAPTEVLSEQHFHNFENWLRPLGVKVVWLSGAVKGRSRNITLQQIQSGEAQIIVGTHVLFQKELQFSRLALVIIDEQHRFGVHQRLALREKGRDKAYYPHQLIMTATPIPRTLAMTAYADLDYSVIDELPPGRVAVITLAVSQNRRNKVIEKVYHHCVQGHQVYWVCTLVEESEALQCQAAEKAYQLLKKQLPELKVGLVHGRMKYQEKEAVMTAFKLKKIQLLVATTVIEVGVDVPNANLIVIENSERFGLAQLHQLRGRVGRSALQSHCVLLYQSPLTAVAKKRLDILRQHHDGFKIAEFDLQLRGPGEVLGTRQTGLPQLKIADLVRDAPLLLTVQRIAKILWEDFPKSIMPLIERWLGRMRHYGNV